MLLQALMLAMAAAAPLAQAQEDVCDLPLETGPCLAAIPRFGFNPKTGECERFIFGGCAGNANNFETLKECEDVCAPPPVPEEVCPLPLETGPCLAAIPRFGFNPKTGACERFIFGGCAGNANNFETLKECEDFCAPTPPPPPADVCKLRLVTGPCRARFIRWGFSTKARKCVKFTYGGCGGNGNRFNTEQECIKVCGK